MSLHTGYQTGLSQASFSQGTVSSHSCSVCWTFPSSIPNIGCEQRFFSQKGSPPVLCLVGQSNRQRCRYSPLLTPIDAGAPSDSPTTVATVRRRCQTVSRLCTERVSWWSVTARTLTERPGKSEACQGGFQKELTAYASLLTLGKLACQGGVGLPVNGRRTRARYFSKGYAGTGVQDALHMGQVRVQ